jgi:CBS domain-containing protein
MNTSSLRVTDYMTRKIVTVSPDTELMRAVYLLVAKELSGVPVVSDDNVLVGMLTERDCLAVAINAGYFDEPGGLVADFMSHSVETATSQDRVVDIAVRFRDTRFRRFPVVDDGNLVGIISRRDVLRALKRGTWFGRR